MLIRLLVLTAACLVVLPASSASAGRLFATGHDLDLHCHFGAQCGYVSTAVSYVRGGAPDPAKPVLVLERLDDDFSTALTNAFGAGVVPSVSMEPRSPAFATTPLSTGLYSAILIGSDITCGGCDLNEFGSTPDSDAINARTGDIASFFNAGGGLLYGSGASHGDGTDPDDVYYESAPLPLGGVAVAPPFTLTPEGVALGLTDADANCCQTHNSFVDPPAGSSIVVAERDSAGSSETLFSEGTIVGGDIFTLTLAPPTGENPVGSPHAVTATLTNQAGRVPGAAIRFVVSGVNPTSGLATTNTAGAASFAYVGTLAGTDTITACLDVNANGACDPGEPTATATKRWTGVLPSTTPAAPIAIPSSGDGPCAPQSTARVPRTPLLRMTASTSPKLERFKPYTFRTTGRIVPPESCAGVPRALLCSGVVTVHFKRRSGPFTSSSRGVGVKSDCTYRSRVPFKLRDPLRRGVLSVRARFEGNTYLLPKEARVQTVRTAASKRGA